jgi:hypothetical protein
MGLLRPKKRASAADKTCQIGSRPAFPSRPGRNTVALAAALGLTLAGGALAGVLAGRWGPAANLVAAGAGLAEIPAEFGDWRLDAELPLEEGEIEMLRCTGHVSRRYLNRSTGQMVEVFVLVGPPGRISVHTPEICYAGAGYRQTAQRAHVSVPLSGGGGEGEFWCTPFISQSRDGVKLAVYYGWSDGGRWSAPKRPRLAYGGRHYLYKLQLNAPLVARRGDEHDVGREFLADFIPALERSGVPAQQETERTGRGEEGKRGGGAEGKRGSGDRTRNN